MKWGSLPYQREAPRHTHVSSLQRRQCLSPVKKMTNQGLEPTAINNPFTLEQCGTLKTCVLPESSRQLPSCPHPALPGGHVALYDALTLLGSASPCFSSSSVSRYSSRPTSCPFLVLTWVGQEPVQLHADFPIGGGFPRAFLVLRLRPPFLWPRLGTQEWLPPLLQFLCAYQACGIESLSWGSFLAAAAARKEGRGIFKHLMLP